MKERSSHLPAQQQAELETTTNIIVIIILCLLCTPLVWAGESYILTEDSKDTFALVSDGKAAALCVSSLDWPGVLKVACHLQTDIKHVTGAEPEILTDETAGNEIVIIGTIGKNPLIDKLIKEKRINAEKVIGRWDTFAVETVDEPLPGVKKALVIFGSNKRGTIYGMYDLSSDIGVSPWYWWADVPIRKNENIYIKAGFYSPGEPKVKYRGIFINDEHPCLSKWAKEKFGGFNHKFYEKVFELILRNRGNYLWPAMWIDGTIASPGFANSDPENPRLADEYGIVIATSHHEPMMRAHQEWFSVQGGEWNYTTNKEKLQEFWRGGIERMADYESVVTVGMRGDGDAAMPGGTQVGLLQTIIADQRRIISEVTGKPADKTPQVWAVYKEVQDYYDKGMRIDDDITILFCDDNWGNIRCLPGKDDLNRKGGFGIYYHFDYVGAPVSYKWTNVTQIERVWEQMTLAYQRGVHQLWIVNAGDIKPHELPVSFFLDLAWDPEAIGAKNLPNYYVNWSRQQFGDEYADQIAEVLSLYTKYNARRTAEMINADTYSIEHYRQADNIVSDYKQLCDKAKNIYDKLPETHKSAFYQLVLFPVESCSNLNEMYVAAGKNRFYIERGAAQPANYYADKTKELFYRDAELHKHYHALENDKWNHILAQTHIGHTRWLQPPVNNMPPVSYAQTTGEAADLGYNVEYGVEYSWGWLSVDGIDWFYNKQLPVFDPVNDQNYYVEIYNKGDEKLAYTIEAQQDWIKLSKQQGTIQFNEKIYITIDWVKAPKENTTGQIVICGCGRKYPVAVPIRNDLPQVHGFVENAGVVSIEAAHFDKAVKTKGINWITVPNLGRTGSSVTIAPFNAESQPPQTLGDSSAHLEYTFTLFDSADVEMAAYLSPTCNFNRDKGLKFAASIDGEEPQVVNIHEGSGWWEKRAGDHIAIKTTKHTRLVQGKHTLKIWMIDPGIVFQKFVINAGGLKPSYLGPPESVYVKPPGTR